VPTTTAIVTEEPQDEIDAPPAASGRSLPAANAPPPIVPRSEPSLATEDRSIAEAATAAAAAAAAKEHLELSERYADALDEITRLQAELSASQQAEAAARARVVEAQAQVQAAQVQAAQAQATAAAASAATLQPVGVRRRTTRVISEDGETVAETQTGFGEGEGSEDEGTAVSGFTGITGTAVGGDTTLAPQVVEGVPLQVVGIIALIVFIATYLFF
jgi:multidrug efflux pump subunit AcrA (membrane-fusion protein)